jgi:D-aspartate ligase
MTPERPVAILGLLWAGLSLARALGRAGKAVTGIALEPHEFGIRSRYLHRRVVASGDEGVLAALRQAAGGGRLVLFPERDAHVAFCLRHWDAVREVADLPLPEDPEIVRRLRRKELLVAEAERAAVGVPPTAAAPSEQAVRRLDLRPPFLVKPVEGQEFAAVFGRKLFVAETVDEAVRWWRVARARGFETVVQELVPDAQDKVFSLFAYIGRRGEPLANVVGRKVRAGPPRFGTAAVFELRDEPSVLETGLRLLGSARYRGFAQVELVHDPRDGELKLLEVNTRPPQWAGIAMTRRFDIAQIAYDDLTGGDVAPAATFTEDGVTWIYLAKDVWSSLELLRRGDLDLRAFARAYVRPKKVRAIFAPDDPLPALASLAYLRAKVA